jgi:hypothetical protein
VENLPATPHALRRMCQRRIDGTAVSLALQLGLEIEQDGAAVYFLSRRSVPRDVGPHMRHRLEGTTVVLSRDGQVITVFKTRRLPRRLRLRVSRPRRHAARH